jgi:hypothetical protein
MKIEVFTTVAPDPRDPGLPEEWPDDWPTPREGDSVTWLDSTYVVESVEWRPQGNPANREPRAIVLLNGQEVGDSAGLYAGNHFNVTVITGPVLGGDWSKHRRAHSFLRVASLREDPTTPTFSIPLPADNSDDATALACSILQLFDLQVTLFWAEPIEDV